MRNVKPESQIKFDAKVLLLARLRRGLTQTDLALKLGVTMRSVQHWEQGTAVPSGPNLLRLAEELGVSTDDLYVREETAA